MFLEQTTSTSIQTTDAPTTTQNQQGLLIKIDFNIKIIFVEQTTSTEEMTTSKTLIINQSK